MSSDSNDSFLSKPLNLTTLRKELFKVVDQVIETGQSIEIERNGHKLKIVLDEKKDKFLNLTKRNHVVLCDEDELIASSSDWKPFL